MDKSKVSSLKLCYYLYKPQRGKADKNSYLRNVVRYCLNFYIRRLMSKFIEKMIRCKSDDEDESDESGSPSYEGDSDSSGNGDGSTGEEV